MVCLQVAFVAGNTFSCVQLFLSFLYLVSKTYADAPYHPGSYMVTPCHAVWLRSLVMRFQSWPCLGSYSGKLKRVSALQQLYLFGGLLTICAFANVQPLWGRLSQFGALFNFVGEQRLDAFL